MNINKIIKKGLSGEEVGKLILEDYLDYMVNLQDEAKKFEDKKTSLKKVLNIEGALTPAETQALIDSVQKPQDIKIYNSYMAILKYLDNIQIKLAYAQKSIYARCMKLSYMLLDATTIHKGYIKKFIKILPGELEILTQEYEAYLTYKTAIKLIEELTGNNNILEVLEFDKGEITLGEKILEVNLTENPKTAKIFDDFSGIEKANKLKEDFNNEDVNNLDEIQKHPVLHHIKIPDEVIENARQTIQDLSFFRDGECSLHHLLLDEGVRK